MRGLIAASAFLLSLAVPFGTAQAQGYPNKPVRIVVPFGAGSATDILTRAVAKGLTERLGQSVVVENRPGAGGNIGAESVARAQPDGYTLVMGTNGPFAANVSLYRKLPHDPINDFEPVILMGRLPMVLIANPKTEASTVAELLSAAKSNPGKLSFGASNTTARVWVELLKDMGGIDVNTVLYKDVGTMVTDLISGQIGFAFENVGPSLPLIRSEKVKALAVTSANRAAFSPETPTLAESGLDRHELVVWFALFAPKGTPGDIVRRLNNEVNALLAGDELKGVAQQIGMDPAGGAPADLAGYHAAEIKKWRGFIDATGIRID